ncbi:copper amine oxidase N-terminal domain-containing protein [Oceanobacillus senegalensis]|uniref:copper amine oxidase N-terminal domain-containing protein n=1 Tax=Oceanobacillus senegalensis TaxID=1936063 RepID=UPI000A30AC3C|nr:copper amine oxidase N-terminal domain-containing protein [Oceanobacillus senegalensis]
MKWAKIIPIAVTAVFVGSIPAVTTARPTTEQPMKQEEVQPVFIKNTGTVESVDVREHANYYTIKEGNNEFVLVVTPDTLVLDNTGKKVELEKGDKVTAHTYADKPRIFIYPPQYSPEVVVVETEARGTAVVGTFNQNLVDANLLLQLKVSKETELSSLSGKKVEMADLTDENLLVFYTRTTRSIPAQTSPYKIVVLDEQEPHQENPPNPVVEDIIANDFYEVDGTKMVPLRILAEALGYKVNATEKGATLSKGSHSYTITRGERAYRYNNALRYFELAPALLIPGKTYLPVSFIERMKDE